MSFADIVSQISDSIWLIALVISLIFGIAIGIWIRGFHIHILGAFHKYELGDKDKNNEKVTSKESFFITLGNHLGVGNIAGIASAIMAGGPGAVFWIWIFSFFNAAVAFAESVLAQLYRSKGADGQYFGSPAYYALKGLNSQRLAIVISVAGIILYASNMTIQTSSAVNAIATALDSQSMLALFGVLFAVLSAVTVYHGVKRVATVATIVVPIMAIIWLIFAVFTICYNYANIPNAFAMIFGYAFSPPALIGGGLGYAIMIAMRRATYSNDAGTGSIARLSAMADTEHPVQQGILQVLGVYICTLFLCTITSLVILTYGDFEKIHALGLNYAPLIQEIMSQTPLGDFAKYIIAIVLFSFAYTTIISCYTMGTSDVKYLTSSKSAILVWFIFSVFAIILGGCLKNSTAENLVDTATAFILIINIYIMYRLRHRIVDVLKDYMNQRSKGIARPVFTKNSLKDTTGVTEWDADRDEAPKKYSLFEE